ncbi:DUF2145 domain-containing protein [Aeromonas veronii]|uniref:DUF2145 domain-containing protein n=1 Tax=Aeromonas veronii TaxID=654 RepID=UPI003D234A6C
MPMNKVAFIMLATLSCSAYAGGFSDRADAQVGKNFSTEELIKFSKKVEKSLAEKGARVAIVSRIGRPEKELPPGVHYTHVAYWVYSKIKTSDGREIPGYQVYNLYQREGAIDTSELVNDYPPDFFAGVDSLRAGIIIPKPSLQKKILDVITSDTYQKLHVDKYSVVANPFNSEYQNCTEFTLDVLTSALYNTSEYGQIKANIKAYFKPQEINLGVMKSLLGPLFVKDFTTRDQNGPIVTATFTTIASFMNEYQLSDAIYHLDKDA